MSKHFQLESLIKKNYFDKEVEGKADEERKEKEKAESDNDSFEVIDSMSEGQDSSTFQAELQDEKRADLADKMRNFSESFDHLSQYDPDDEFLKSNRSFSIIDNILVKNGRIG